jgi:hypothetical protein
LGGIQRSGGVDLQTLRQTGQKHRPRVGRPDTPRRHFHPIEYRRRQRPGDKSGLAERFLYIARGSLCELESQIDVCLRAGLIEVEDSRSIAGQMTLVGRLIGGLITYRKYRSD